MEGQEKYFFSVSGSQFYAIGPAKFFENQSTDNVMAKMTFE